MPEEAEEGEFLPGRGWWIVSPPMVPGVMSAGSDHAHFKCSPHSGVCGGTNGVKVTVTPLPLSG